MYRGFQPSPATASSSNETYAPIRLGPPTSHPPRTSSAGSSRTIDMDRSARPGGSESEAAGAAGPRIPSSDHGLRHGDEGFEMLSAPQPIRLNTEDLLGAGGGGQAQGYRTEHNGARRDRRISLNSRLGPSPPPPPGPPPSEPPPLPPPSSASASLKRTSTSNSIQSIASAENHPRGSIRRTPSVQSGLMARPSFEQEPQVPFVRETSLGPPVMSMGIRQAATIGNAGVGEDLRHGGGSGDQAASLQPMQRTLPRVSSINALQTMAGPSVPQGQLSPTVDVFGGQATQQAPVSHRPRTSNATSLSSNYSTSSGKPPRIPSKQLLQLALDLAQKAVEQDRANDVEGALSMYREAVGKLRAVMERVGIEVGPVPSGLGLPDLTDREREEAEHARRKRQANGSARPEDEGRTLRGIHDAYIARIGLLIVMQAAQKSPTSSHFHGRHDSGALSASTHNPSSSAGSMSAIGNLMMSGTVQSSESNASTPVKQAASSRISGGGGSVDSSTAMDLVNGVTSPSDRAARETSLHAEMDALYPPPISILPVPRPRVASLQNRDVEAANMRTPQLSGPDINIVAGTPQWGANESATTTPIARASPSLHGRRSSVNQANDDEVLSGGLEGQGLPSANSDHSLGSARSGKRRSARESMMKASSSGLDQELGVEGDGEEQEVLSQTPTGEFMGDALGVSSSPRSAKFDGMSSLRRDPSEAPLISPRAASLGSGSTSGAGMGLSPIKPVMISASTAAASIVQRRRNGGEKQMSISSVIEEDETSYDVIRPGESGTQTPPALATGKALSDGANTFSLKSASFLGDWSKDIAKLKNEASLPSRLRTRSQPGKRPSISKAFDPGEPMPPLPSQTPLSASGVSGKYSLEVGGNRSLTNALSPGPTSGSTTIPPPSARRSPSLPSPLPEAPPQNALHRPFYLMRLISNSVQSPNGGFLSDRLHVPRAMWVQTTVKVPALETKVRVVDLLTVNVLNVARAGDGLLMTPEEAQVGGGRSPASAFGIALEELEGLMDEVQKMLSKKLGLTSVKSKGGIGGFGSKFAKTLDKMTNGKNMESPTAYVESLSRLCQEAQAIDRHISCLTGPSHTVYSTLPSETRNAIEIKIRRISDFFTQVLLAFVFQDIGLMLSKYLKHSTRWIED